MDICAVRDVTAGIGLDQLCGSVAAVELVRGTCADEPTVAGLLEGEEVPVGIFDIGTVDLVPLYVAAGICLNEPCPLVVDGVLEVVAGERVSSVACLLSADHVQIADASGWKDGLRELLASCCIDLQQKGTAGVVVSIFCIHLPDEDGSAVRGQPHGLEIGICSGRVVALPDQRASRVELEKRDFASRISYLAADHVASVCCLPD